MTINPLLEMTRTTPTVLWNDSADPAELAQSISFGAVGATCNPVIALTCIKSDLARWTARITELADEMPTASESQIGWRVVEELSVQAARLLLPACEEHRGVNGRLSMQTDPRNARNAEALVAQAQRFSALAPNIIVKIPATKVGIRAIEEATYRGVSVNVTVSFSVPQAVQCGEAIERGLSRREAEGLDVATMGPVVTIMVGRLDDWLKDVYQRERLTFDPASLEWGGIAAMKKAYQIFTERGLRARLLSAAFRNTAHWSEFIGGNVVISPPFAWQRKCIESGTDAGVRMDNPVDPAILADLASMPEFVKAYQEDGMTPDQFDDFGATRKTMRQFLAADAELDSLIRDVLIPAP